MEFLKSIGILLRGILKRIYWLLPSLISDPFDIAERWFGRRYVVPSYVLWVLLFLGFFIAVILTYYDLYKQKILKDKELDQYKKQNEFHFEFNDNSITTRDGRILLGVTFFSNIEVVVEKLELELDDRLFKPLDWATFKFKHIHTKNFTFNLTNLQDVNTDKYQDAKFIVVVDNIKHESRSFDIRKLL